MGREGEPYKSRTQTTAASWYIDTLRRSTQPPFRNPLGLPSPMHTIASVDSSDPIAVVSAVSSVDVPALARTTLSNVFHAADLSHFARCVSNCILRLSTVRFRGASAGTSVEVEDAALRCVRRALPPVVMCVQPSSSVTWSRFWGCGRFRRVLCGMVWCVYI